MNENNDRVPTATERRLRDMGVRDPHEIPKAQRIDCVYDTHGVGDELLEF